MGVFDRLEKGIRKYCDDTGNSIDKAMGELGINRGSLQASLLLRNIPAHYFIRIMATTKNWKDYFSIDDVYEYLRQSDEERESRKIARKRRRKN